MSVDWNAEWRNEVRQMNEVERDIAANSHRDSIGLIGDPSDALDEMPRGRRG